MRWILSLLPLLLFAACGDSSEETASSLETPDLRQQLYNRYLETSRELVAEDPDVACDPLMWITILAPLELSVADKVLAEFSLIDACHEMGELSDSVKWSPYYADAP